MGTRWGRIKESVIFIFFIGLFAIVQIHKGQPINFDVFNYHYYNGFAFLHGRFGADIAVANIQSYFNPLLDSLIYFLDQHCSARTVAYILGGLCGLNGYFLYKIVNHFFVDAEHKTYKVILSLVIGLTGATALGQVGNPMNDSQSAIPIMLGLFLLVKNQGRSCIWGAFWLGVGVALKLTNAIYLLAAFIAFVLTLESKKLFLKQVSIFILSSIVGFMVFDGYFAWQLYVTFGNPFFPLFNNIFHSPYYSFTTFKDPRFGVHEWYQLFTFPFLLMKKGDLFSELHCRDWRLGIFFILLIFTALKWMRQGNQLFAFLTLFLVCSYALWAVQFGIYRYAIPLQLVSGPLIIYMGYLLVKNPKLQIFLAFAITVVLVTTTIHPNFYYQKDFNHRYLSLNAGALPHNALILITTGGAESFVIPFFPPEDRFLGLDFSSQLNQKIIYPIIRQSALPLYVVFNPGDEVPPAPALYPVAALTELKEINLAPDWSKCRKLHPDIDKFYINNVTLCPLDKLNAQK